MTRIGDSSPRPDGFAKVAGAARYGDDFSLPGMLYGATVRSPHPHAAIREIRWLPEEAPEGAVCVLASDLPGPNGVQLLDDSWPILADGVVRHVGEPVALVAASTRLAARQARTALRVEYEARAAALDPEAEGLETLHELSLGRGDTEAVFAAAAERDLVVVEGSWRTGHQEHIYIECQVMTAWYEDDGTLVVVGSMQCPYYVQKSLIHALGLPADKVRIKVSAVGGGFGGKEDYPSVIALHAALLAGASGRPVRLVYDRHEDIVATTKRHPSIIRHRTAVDADGRLQAIEVDVTLDGGAYTTLSPVVLSRALLHAAGPYRCPNVRVRGRVVRTHTATNGAFRGFGAPQAEFAAERQMDRVGRRMGLDPLEIRMRNAIVEGDHYPTGQVADGTTSARLCLERVQSLTGFRERWRRLEEARLHRKDGEPLRGLGLSLYFHGAGFTGEGERRMRSPVTVQLMEDGRLELLTAMTDMGQGTVAVLPMIVCESADLDSADVVLAEPDTARVPDSGPTVASRTTMVVGGVLARAAVELRDRLLDWVAADGERPAFAAGVARFADGSEASFRELGLRYRQEVGPLEVTLRHEPPEWQSFDEETYEGDAYPTFSWGADVAEVEIDPDTLRVQPVKVTAVCEIGRALHKTLCAGQVEGGTLQAVGWALLEEIKVEEGRYLNDRLATYIIPTFPDSPRIEVELLESPWKEGPFGAKGVGELPMDGAAPAIAAAIENASGLEVDAIPATPERLMRAQHEGRSLDPARELVES